MDTSTSPPRTARAKARAELTSAIKAAARRQLAEVGAASLSVRAVARELEMASSAVYRYFPGRDELLTALIADTYGDVADVAQRAVEASAGQLFRDRWLTLSRAIRHWAVDNPHDYELIYGSPVPGYAAPRETAEPAQRLTSTLLVLLVEATRNGEVAPEQAGAIPPSVAEALGRIRSLADGDVDDAVLLRAVGGWTQLFGHLSFELFGQFHTVVDDYEVFFDSLMLGIADRIMTRSS